MKRFFTTISAFVVVFAAIYSGSWFYYSKKVKNYTDRAFVNLAKRIGSKGSEFLYSNSSVAGFPLAFEVHFSDPKFIIEENDVSSSVSSEEDLVVNANLFATDVSVSLPRQLQISNIDYEEKETWLLKYNDVASFDIKAKMGDLVDWVFKGGFAGGGNMPEFSEVRYRDKGYVMTNILQAKESSSSSGGFFEIAKQKDGSYNFSADFKDANIAAVNAFLGDGDALGDLDITVNASYHEGEESRIKIEDFDFSSDGFAFNVKGNVASEEAESLPFGNMQIKIEKYAKFVDYNSSLINHIVRNSAFPLFRIKNEQVEAFKRFLTTVASERYNDDEDVLILLSRSKNGSLRIGEFGLSDALQILKSGKG